MLACAQPAVEEMRGVGSPHRRAPGPGPQLLLPLTREGANCAVRDRALHQVSLRV